MPRPDLPFNGCHLRDPCIYMDHYSSSDTVSSVHAVSALEFSLVGAKPSSPFLPQSLSSIWLKIYLRGQNRTKFPKSRGSEGFPGSEVDNKREGREKVKEFPCPFSPNPRMGLGRPVIAPPKFFSCFRGLSFIPLVTILFADIFTKLVTVWSVTALEFHTWGLSLLFLFPTFLVFGGEMYLGWAGRGKSQ